MFFLYVENNYCSDYKPVTTEDFSLKEIVGVISLIISFFVIGYFIHIPLYVNQEKAISYTHFLNEDGKMKKLVQESLKDGSLSLSERYQIYFERDRQKELFEKRLEENKLKEIYLK